MLPIITIKCDKYHSLSVNEAEMRNPMKVSFDKLFRNR